MSDRALDGRGPKWSRRWRANGLFSVVLVGATGLQIVVGLGGSSSGAGQSRQSGRATERKGELDAGVSGTSSEPPAKSEGAVQAPRSSPPVPLLRMERDGESAGCPSFQVEIYADGASVYRGGKLVRVHGEVQRTLPANTVNRLEAAVRAIRVPDDERWRGAFLTSFSEHGPRDLVRIEYNGKREKGSVLFSHAQCGVPHELHRLAEELTNVVANWTGKPSAGCVAWRKSSRCSKAAPTLK